MSAPIKCRVVFSVGGKGGVGKSWLISLLAQWAGTIDVRLALVDCDDETSTTTRFFPKATFLAIRSGTEIDRLVETATSGDFDLILVDLPARAADEFQRWFAVVPWSELSSLGVRFTAVGVISGSKDSIECILRWREFLGDNVDYVLALNQRDDLAIYMQSNAREKFRSYGAVEIEIAKLDEGLAMQLDRANWTISAALQSRDAHLLTRLMTRARLGRYLQDTFNRFSKAKALLLP